MRLEVENKQALEGAEHQHRAGTEGKQDQAKEKGQDEQFQVEQAEQQHRAVAEEKQGQAEQSPGDSLLVKVHAAAMKEDWNMLMTVNN